MDYKGLDIYEFPPFFTKQINETTWQAQLKQWEQVCLDYCKQTRQWQLARDSPLFTNPRIQRSLRPEVVMQVFTDMVSQGSAAWRQDKQSVFVYVRTPGELASEILDWAQASGQRGTVLTLYELTSGDLTGLDGLRDLDHDILVQAIGVLDKRGDVTEMKEGGETVAIKLK